MSLEQQIQSDIKAAMVAKDKVALAATRAVKAAILLAKTSEGGAKDSLEDSEVVKIVQKLVKQRKESAEIYSQQNRQDLADNELAEAATMEKYLPAALSEAQVEDAVRTIIAETGASSMADMGKVMGVATKKLAGQADGRLISTIVKKLLSYEKNCYRVHAFVLFGCDSIERSESRRYVYLRKYRHERFKQQAHCREYYS